MVLTFYCFSKCCLTERLPGYVERNACNRKVDVLTLHFVQLHSDQFYHWQDLMMGVSHGLMTSTNGAPEEPEAIWPGDCRPGLYLNLMAKFSHILRHLIALEIRDTGVAPCKQPPVFEYGTTWITNEEQLRSRDLYFDVVTNKTTKQFHDQALKQLDEAISLNPNVGEFFVVKAQILISRGLWKEAEEAAVRGVRLLCDWTTVWDKRMSWWVFF